LSNQFREILVAAGLVEPRGHEATGKGRSQARETSEISFHSLRHSAVTMLKASGLSDVFAREIVGHESAAISRQPDSTKGQSAIGDCLLNLTWCEVDEDADGKTS
jgi:hypothetical protein